ncbi:MAG: hypothetical protein PUC12_05405 [Clostridiales bacterium]|nr:hypothetical protein [Clostridiales bacterium]
MNIRETINEISNKYNLRICGLTYENKIKQSVRQILNNIPKNKIVGIKGAGEHTSQLLSLSEGAFSPQYIFNKRNKIVESSQIDGKTYTIYPDSYIDKVNLDVMIVSSYAHRREMEQDLKKYSNQFQIIDIYDELLKDGLEVNAPFYRNAEDTYENVLYYRKEYNKNSNATNLKNLIVAYLHICDFINYIKYSKEYIKKGFIDWEIINSAMIEMQNMLDGIKKVVSARKQKDIITIWNDQLGYSELKFAPYMNKASEESLFFENAYTMTPFTVPTFFEMFQGLKSLDDGIYHKQFPVFDSTNSELIEYITKEGYKFVYVGDEADARLFSEEYARGSYTYNSTCIRCVDLLQVLIDEERPVCAILHSLVETHNPYLSGELDSAKWYDWPRFMGDTEETAMKQMKKSLVYWDKQLNYFMNFLSDNAVRIYMSDHGKRFNIQPIYKNDTTHLVFFVLGKDVPSKRLRKMFSIYDYKILLQAIVENRFEEDYLCKDYCLLQETNIFNNATICYYIENGVEECGYAFRAVRTQTELYVKLSSGTQYYYILPDEETNHVCEEKYRHRVKELDKLAGDYFDNPRKYEEELAFFRKKFETHE